MSSSDMTKWIVIGMTEVKNLSIFTESRSSPGRNLCQIYHWDFQNS